VLLVHTNTAPKRSYARNAAVTETQLAGAILLQVRVNAIHA
jgi:hypothetical protein